MRKVLELNGKAEILSLFGMILLFRLSNLADKSSPKKVYPTITYKYSNLAKLKEVVKKISSISGIGEGNWYSVILGQSDFIYRKI